MKRKLAFLLAVVMIAAMASVNAFAATNNVSIKTLSNVPQGTLLFEQGLFSSEGKVMNGCADGTDLVIRVGDRVPVYGQIHVDLTNATWAFDGETQAAVTAAELVASGSGLALVDDPDISAAITAAPIFLDGATVADGTFVDANGARTFADYNIDRGFYTTYPVKNNGGSINTTAIDGTYYRYNQVSQFQDGAAAPPVVEVPYRLDIYGDSNALLTVLPVIGGDVNNGSVQNGYYQSGIPGGVTYEIRIPIVELTDPDNAANTLVTLSNSTINVSQTTQIVTKLGATGVIAQYGGGNDTERDAFTVDTVTFSEQMLGAANPGGVNIGSHYLDPSNKSDLQVLNALGGDNNTLYYGKDMNDNYYTFAGGSVIFTLPRGFHWYDPFTEAKNANVSLSPGLAWTDQSVVPDAGSSYNFSTTDSSNRTYIVAGAVKLNTVSKYPLWSFSQVLPTYSRNGQVDDTMLKLTLYNFTKSQKSVGSITVTGLRFYCDEDMTFGTVATMGINADPSGNALAQSGPTNYTLGVSPTVFTVATRTDWLVSLTAASTPTLVSGRWIWDDANGLSADNATHATDVITFKELAPAAWWSLRQTVFQLPVSGGIDSPGVKIRKLQITDQSNVIDTDNPLKGNYYSNLFQTSGGAGVYMNDGEKHGYITVKDSQFTISNIAIKTSMKASISFKLWLSVEFGYGAKFGGDTGIADVSLTVPSMVANPVSGVPDANNSPSCVVAKVVDPVTVSVDKVTDLAAGLQYQPAGVITIKETGAHMLLAGKQVRISVSDLISSDMYFTNNVSVVVTDGDLKIDNISNTGGMDGYAGWSDNYAEFVDSTGTYFGYAGGQYGGQLDTNQASTDAGITFDIARESTVASTITISNVGLKVYRDVPLTNKQFYKAIVWGSAIAENFGYMWPDPSNIYPCTSKFTTPGAIIDYVKVATDNTDISMMDRKVTVTIGQSYYTINGKSYDMGASAYISNSSNSTMVPVRFIANALGISDDQIVWDNDTKTVTIITPSKSVQFTANSPIMRVNGNDITMQSLDVPPMTVYAELDTQQQDDRMYVPMRALAQAFGISVAWDETTQTVTYNPDAVDVAN